MSIIESGRILRGDASGCVVGCTVDQLAAPSFGGLVRIPLGGDMQVYGLIYNISIADDGLVRQLVTAGDIPEEVIQDNRVNRNVPVEMSVLFTGYEQGGRVLHLLPPRPPLTLDAMYLCDPAEVVRFTAAGRLGYFRHILRFADIPVGELIAAHIRQAGEAHQAQGDAGWVNAARQEVITILRDDYQTLMAVLSAIGELENG